MDMNPHKLDDLFKGKLEHPSMPPVNEVHWKEARGMLNQGNRSSRWLLGLFLFALSAGMIYYALNDLNDDGSDGLITSLQVDDVEANGEITAQNDGNEYLGIDQNITPVAVKDGLTEKTVRSQKGVGMSVPEENNEKNADDMERKTVLDFQRDVAIAPTLLEADASVLPNQVDVEEYADNGIFKSPSDPSFSAVDLVVNRQKVPLLSGRLSSLMAAKTRIIQPLLTGTGLIQVERFRQRRVGAFGTLMLRPSQGQSPVRGMIIGVSLDRFLNRTWFAGVRPSLHIKFNEPGFAKFQHHISYSFEATNTTYGPSGQKPAIGSLAHLCGICQGGSPCEGRHRIGVSPGGQRKPKGG